jgi:hypothetical protein
MNLDDRGQRPRLLIHDRDSKFSRTFDALFRSDGIRVIRTPVRAPERERPRRALGRQRPARVSRPDPHLQPATAGEDPSRLCVPLQRAEATSCARPTSARPAHDASDARRADHRSDSTTRPAGRADPRIRSSRSMRRSKCTPRVRKFDLPANGAGSGTNPTRVSPPTPCVRGSLWRAVGGPSPFLI